MPANDFSLLTADSAQQKLGHLRMSADDALAVIKNAEATGSYVTETASGHRFAHLQIGSITLWVDYRQLDEHTFVLESTWAHRIKIMES